MKLQWTVEKGGRIFALLRFGYGDDVVALGFDRKGLSERCDASEKSGDEQEIKAPKID